MTLDDVMKALAAKGSDATKRLWIKHGAREPFFGVKIADLKVIQKKLKGDQALALKLYATGNGDAQYLAGLIADGARMIPAQLERWAESAAWGMISGFTVPWVASEHPDGFTLGFRWIDSPRESVAVAGWKTLAALVAVRADAELPVKQLSALLDRTARMIAQAPDDVRLAMNQFIIACGAYLAELGERAIATARRIGQIEADRGDTACKIPEAESTILKLRRGARVASERKTVRC